MKPNGSKFTITFILALLGVAFQASAQTKEQEKLQKKAFTAYLDKDYELALHYLAPLDTAASPIAGWYDYQIGMCLLSTDRKLEAIPYLESAKKSGLTSFVVDYYLGRAYLFAGRLQEARFYLNAYALQFMASGHKFGFTEKVKSEGHRVHVEKSLQDIVLLLAECDARIKDGRVFSSNQ